MTVVATVVQVGGAGLAMGIAAGNMAVVGVLIGMAAVLAHAGQGVAWEEAVGVVTEVIATAAELKSRARHGGIAAAAAAQVAKG